MQGQARDGFRNCGEGVAVGDTSKRPVGGGAKVDWVWSLCLDLVTVRHWSKLERVAYD